MGDISLETATRRAGEIDGEGEADWMEERTECRFSAILSWEERVDIVVLRALLATDNLFIKQASRRGESR